MAARKRARAAAPPHDGYVLNIDIRSAANGLILKIRGAFDEDTREVVYQQVEDDEVEAFAEFLRFVLDQYGPSTSQYSPKRIHVIVEPGDKYEGGEID